jgi:hypothetical protein
MIKTIKEMFGVEEVNVLLDNHRQPVDNVMNSANSQHARESVTGISNDNNLCNSCSQIDFDNLFKYALENSDDGVIQMPNAGNSPVCQLCKFLLKVGSPQELILPEHRFATGLTLKPVSDAVYLGCLIHKQADFCWLIAKESLSKNGEVLGLVRNTRDSSTNSCIGRVQNMVDWTILRRWLEYCNIHHTKTCKHSRSTLALKVIECSSRKIIMLPKSAEYITLSYLWGETAGETNSTLTKLPEIVPTVIEDSLTVARTLGFRYLWIDRYCISQDDEREKHRLIQNMNKIYAQSTLTIVAASGNGPFEGLCGVSSERYSQDVIQINNHTLISSIFDNTIQSITDSTWNSRGWTFQEGLLSCKRLVFTYHQVYFQCQEMRCFESLPVSPSQLHGESGKFKKEIRTPRAFPDQNVGTSPTEIVQRIDEFMKRDLWTNHDTIAAFSGILQQFRAMKNPVRSVCGLPIFPPSGFRHSASM